MHALKFSDKDISDPQKRMGYISSAISDVFSSRWSAAAMDTEASADIQVSIAPGVSLSHATMSALTLDNACRQQGVKPKFYAYITDQPQTIKLRSGRAFYVQPRELLVLSSDLPCQIVTTRTYTTTSLVIDADLFQEYVPDYKAVIARRLAYPFGIQDILANSLDSCLAISEGGRFEDMGPRVTRSFLELLAILADEKRPDESAKLSTGLDIRRAQVKAFIDRYFRDPDLTISVVAERLNLTARYIQLAFATDEQTPSEYLRQRRLDACARELMDMPDRRKSITEIAFGNGFNSSSHFSTEFKRVYGMTPRDWRLRAV